jgi:mono/diheme cytochrome c family protein
MFIIYRVVAVITLLVPQSSSGQPSLEARGEYLVKRVAMCVQCHSPRDSQGALLEDKLFLGAPIPVQVESRDWAIRAPRIARLPGWSDADFIRFLQTGKRPDGSFPQRPMPPFRMNQADAAAIAAFLMSVKTSE